MRMMLAFFLLIGMSVGASAAPGDFRADGHGFIQVASTKDRSEAERIATSLSRHAWRYGAMVFASHSGYFGVVLAHLPEDQARTRLDELLRTKAIPSDSFVSDGVRYRALVYLTKRSAENALFAEHFGPLAGLANRQTAERVPQGAARAQAGDGATGRATLAADVPPPTATVEVDGVQVSSGHSRPFPRDLTRRRPVARPQFCADHPNYYSDTGAVLSSDRAPLPSGEGAPKWRDQAFCFNMKHCRLCVTVFVYTADRSTPNAVIGRNRATHNTWRSNGLTYVLEYKDSISFFYGDVFSVAVFWPTIFGSNKGAPAGGGYDITQIAVMPPNQQGTIHVGAVSLDLRDVVFRAGLTTLGVATINETVDRLGGSAQAKGAAAGAWAGALQYVTERRVMPAGRDFLLQYMTNSDDPRATFTGNVAARFAAEAGGVIYDTLRAAGRI